jgi:hypothetical protein
VAHEALDVGAADERDVVAELLGIEIGQPAAVLMLFLGHFHEHLGGGWVSVHQGMGKTGIGARIVILAGDGERQKFLFGEVGKALHGKSSSRQKQTLESFQSMVQTCRRITGKTHL